jgi:hypothetical protein
MSIVEGEFHKTIDIKSIGQGAFGSGLFKDWIERIALEIFKPEYSMFV